MSQFRNFISIFISMIAFLSASLCQSNSWNKINTVQENKLITLCSDSKGNFYVSLNEVGRIAKVNIFTGSKELFEKPIINKEQIYGMLLFTGYNDEIHPILNGNVYTYHNNTYIPVLLSDGTNGKLSDPKTTYYNTLGESFSVDFSSVYKYTINWKINSLNKLYFNNYSANLFAPSFYVPDTNFILEYLPGSSKNNILNLNTNTAISIIVHSFDAPIKLGQFSILDRDGRFYIPTGQELYYFSDFGKNLIVPLIDTFSNGYISAFARGRINKELVIIKGDKFYISYDDCKTWLKPISINKKLPQGRLTELVVWDSLHAIAVVMDGCTYEHLYFLDGRNREWKAFNYNLIDNLNLSEFEVDEKGNYLSVLNDCRRYVSIDKGLNWELIPRVNNIDNQSFPTDYTYYQITEKKDLAFYKDSLFTTDDYGKTWKGISKLPPKTKRMIYLGNGKFLIKSEPILPNAQYYMSYDYGQTYELKFIDQGNQFDSNIFELDHNNNLISYSYINYFISMDDGKSWNIDDRFQGREIRHLEYSNDGTYYMTTKINNIFALYSTNDFINFKNLTSGLGQFFNITFNVHKLQNKIILETYNKPDEFKLYYSEDSGNQWNQINYDIANKRSDDRIALVNFSYLDTKNQLLICLANDGLYSLSNPLIGAFDINQNNSIQISPQPVSEFINLAYDDAIHLDNYWIYDSQGRSIRHSDLNHKQISIQTLTEGVYILQLLDGNIVSWTGRFVKI
ncbi:MAG: hypothetical protein ABI851_11840 [Saprospiraceae bacterium]